LNFVKNLRGELSAERKALVKKAYEELSKKCEGKVTIKLMKEIYLSKLHPGVLDGRKTAETATFEFLDSFSMMCRMLYPGHDMVSEDMFVEYYSYISATIESNSYFETMLINVW